jgi:hypothetical protein
MTNTQFEQMQFSNEVNQGQDFDSTDHSKVDKYKPYNYDCGSYTHRYSRRWTDLDADSNEQDFDN